MSKSPAENLPPLGSPDFVRAIERVIEHLDITSHFAEVALGIAHGLTEIQLAGWLRISPYAVHERMRRLFQKPGLGNRQVVARRVGEALPPDRGGPEKRVPPGPG